MIFAINKTDAVSEVESITSEKCLLYVAMTRAQKGVYITSYGRPSEFLVWLELELEYVWVYLLEYLAVLFFQKKIKINDDTTSKLYNFEI